MGKSKSQFLHRVAELLEWEVPGCLFRRELACLEPTAGALASTMQLSCMAAGASLFPSRPTWFTWPQWRPPVDQDMVTQTVTVSWIQLLVIYRPLGQNCLAWLWQTVSLDFAKSQQMNRNDGNIFPVAKLEEFSSETSQMERLGPAFLFDVWHNSGIVAHQMDHFRWSWGRNPLTLTV